MLVADEDYIAKSTERAVQALREWADALERGEATLTDFHETHGILRPGRRLVVEVRPHVIRHRRGNG